MKNSNNKQKRRINRQKKRVKRQKKMTLKMAKSNIAKRDLNKKGKVTIYISRGEVETGNINAALSTLNIFLTPPLSDSRNSLEINFLGYLDDHRELFEIPECREFMRRLDTHWSLWLYFLSFQNATDVILPLLLDTNPKRIGQNKIYHKYNPHDILHYLSKINYLADNRLITENELRDVWRQTMLGMGMKVNF